MSALVVLLVPGFVVSAAAAPDPTPHRAAASDHGTREPFPPDDSLLFAQTSLAASSRVGRVKLNITIPATTAIAAALFPPAKYQYFPPVDETSGLYDATGGFEPARRKPNCRYAVGFIINWVWPVDAELSDDAADPPRPGRIRSVGDYPPVPVSFLAFGSIPVTAVLHLRLPRDEDGRSEPLVAIAAGAYKSVRRDDPNALNGDGNCDASWESDLFTLNNLPTVVTGRLELTVSDVTVDGRAVPVGRTCRTVSPLSLHLNGANFNGVDQNLSYVSVTDGGVLTQQRNPRTVAANGVRLYPGSRNLVIPPFTGCRDAKGDDISRLVTSFVSGSDNALAVRQAPARVGLDPNRPSACSPMDETCVDLPNPVRPPVPGR